MQTQETRTSETISSVESTSITFCVNPCEQEAVWDELEAEVNEELNGEQEEEEQAQAQGQELECDKV